MAKFTDAPTEVSNIARKLIQEHHSHLIEAKIGYLFREGTWVSKGQAKWGQAKKLGLAEKHLTGLDFVLIFNEDVWNGLPRKYQIALVDHELAHCGCREDGAGNRLWETWPHDVEDFIAIVRRHGYWQQELKAFLEALHEHEADKEMLAG